MSDKKLMLCDKLTLYHSKSLNLPIYMASEVDAAIAELKAKLAEKDKEIESMKASHYAEMVDAGMRERRLRRALYKACANWAHHRVFVRFKSNEKAWENVERKCRAKMEEYK